MAYWEFLLQKEGDRDWLPLEAAYVEVSEGRYRIMAHTSFRETAVEIELDQCLTDSLPPRRKTYKRLALTHENGLMVVMPFTHLTPGSWQLLCRAIAPDTGNPLVYGVQLQVIAIESGVEYWDTDFEPELALSPDNYLECLASNSVSLEPTTSSPSGKDPAVTGQPLVNLSFPLTPTNLDAQSLQDLPLRLQLQHQALVAHPAPPLYLQGQVTSFSEVDGLPTEGTFWWQLRDPETGEVVHQAARSHSIATLPSRFTLPLTLPSDVTTRLLVGELSLWTAAEPPQILAIQGFSITLNLDTLLELVANRAEQSPEAIFEEASTSDTPESGDDSLPPVTPKILSPLSPREIPFRLIYLPSTGLTLPPVIYRPMDRKTVGAPTLPPPEAEPTAEFENDGGDRTSSSVTLPPIGNTRNRPLPAPPAVTPRPTAPSLDLPPLKTDPVRDRRPPKSPTPPPVPFQPDLQSRFWDRLSALAEAAQKAAAEQKAQMEAAGVEAEGNALLPTFSLVDLPSFADRDRAPNYEIVVYEPEPTEAVIEGAESAPPVVEVVSPADADLEDMGAVPMPELVMPEGDLIAGTALPISVRLPQYPRRLAVKVWVTDIQTRTLADRPRWLMNWTPTDTGEQTAFLQLQVPLGSLEAQFEAIAIDLATQRESYKISQVRAIVPPNLPPAIAPTL